MPLTVSWLAGTTAAVTSADGKLGRAIAASLASRKLSLALAGTDPVDLYSTAEEVTRIRALHKNEAAPLIIDADATTSTGMRAIQTSTAATLGPLDALVHVVEIGDASMLAAASAAVLSIAGQGLIRRGGALVFTVLAGPWRRSESHEARSAMNAALDGVVSGAAQALRRRIAVNGVLLEAQPRSQVRSLGFEALSGAVRPAGAVPQSADFDEAARIVRFLASREAQALTGQTLRVGKPLAEAA